MDVEPSTLRDRQGFRLEDLVEAGHHDDLRLIGLKTADKRLRIRVGGDVHRPPKVTRDSGNQVRLRMRPLPARAADGGPQGGAPLEQGEQGAGSIAGGTAA